MGLTLEFYIGQTDRIVSAIKEGDLDRLDAPQVVRRKADFSLHIVPNDLNLLSREIGRATGVAPIELRSHLKVLVDEEDRGVLEVSSTWIDYAAAASESNVPDIAEKWVSAMNRENKDQGRLTDELLHAIYDLVALCKSAKEEKTKVLHVWFA